MRLLTLFFVSLLSACTEVQLTHNDINGEYDEPTTRYNGLVNTIKAKPALPAIQELKQLVVSTDRFKISTVDEKAQDQTLFGAIEAGQWALCLEQADASLGDNYARLNSHYGAMVCRLELGEQTQSQYHQSVLNLLLEAVWLTGDGESIETAFQMINTVERNAFLEFHGLDFIKDTHTQHDGQDYSLVTLYDAQKDAVFEWYFTQLK